MMKQCEHLKNHLATVVTFFEFIGVLSFAYGYLYGKDNRTVADAKVLQLGNSGRVPGLQADGAWTRRARHPDDGVHEPKEHRYGADGGKWCLGSRPAGFDRSFSPGDLSGHLPGGALGW